MTTSKGGFPIAEEDRANLPYKHLCETCKLILRAAIQTTCGHRYCLDCTEDGFSKGNGHFACVNCGEELDRTKIFRDKFADREIQSIVVLCIFVQFGCKWKGQLVHRQEHQKTCKYIPFNCLNNGCDKQVTRESLPLHLQNECQFREVLCSYCGKSVHYNKLKEHEELCPQMLVSCEFCKKDFTREQLIKHKDPNGVDVCEKLMATCAYNAVGCPETKVMNSEERLAHQQEHVEKHQNLLLIKIQNLAAYLDDVLSLNQNGRKSRLSQMLQSACDQTLSQVNALYSELNNRMLLLEDKSAGKGESTDTSDLAARLETAEIKCADQEFLLNEAHQTIGELRGDLTKTNAQLEKAQEKIKKLEKFYEEQQTTEAIRNIAVSDLEVRMNNAASSTSVDGILLWKIVNVARRRTEASTGRQISFYSPPFYTDPYGYKMCARIYLNGDGMGRGTHISLFFVIMRGEYDALLKWPFRQKVSMMLLDQDGGEHVIDAFRPDPNSSSFKRPRAEMNIASGCPMFCAHSELQKHSYIKDDIMFVKLIVDRPDWK